MFTSGTLKKSLVEALCLWKNLCSRKNQERKKVLSKKKKKKEKNGPKKKERVPFCKEKKNFLCKRDMSCRSSTLASIFRTKKSPSNQTLPYTMLKTRFPFLYWSLDTKTSTIASNRNFKSCLSICCLAPQHIFRLLHFYRGFSLPLATLLIIVSPSSTLHRAIENLDPSSLTPGGAVVPLFAVSGGEMISWRGEILFANLYELKSRIWF